MTTIYLSNKELLKEIHASKCSFCWFKDSESRNYDLIVHSVGQLSTKEVIDQAKSNRASRLLTKDLSKIPTEDLVFRVMTWEHVPHKDSVSNSTDLDDDDVDAPIIDPNLKNKNHIRVNFPPFKHYKIKSDGSLECVGISHWKGDDQTGYFCKDHGSITRNLALMFMKLSDRYASRSNWRGYTYLEEMKGQALLQLSQVGLQFDESKSDNPFAYYTATVTNSFTRILNLEKRNQNIRDDLLEINGMNPSYTRQWGSGTSSSTYSEE